MSDYSQATSELLNAYVQRGLAESGETNPAKRLLLAAALLGEGEEVLAVHDAEVREVTKSGIAEALDRWAARDNNGFIAAHYEIAARIAREWEPGETA